MRLMRRGKKRKSYDMVDQINIGIVKIGTRGAMEWGG